jgi:hypothetical protein
METLGKHELWSFPDESGKVKFVKSNTEVRKGEGCPVASYLELATKIAELQFRNKSHVLMFRGQNGDFRNRVNNTTIKPGLFRPDSSGKNPSADILFDRFASLDKAEKALIEAYAQQDFLGKDRIQRTRVLRWSILQHYEVCPTPLLDVTHSLRIAASFASLDNHQDRAFIYVLGLPNLSGGITASSEAGIQTIRLSSVCPPQAIRPHIQEGYLLGEYPELDSFEQETRYGAYEIDFGLRLVAKFYFHPVDFWNSPSFPRVPREALYPNADDPLYKMAQELRSGKACFAGQGKP